MPPIRGTEFIRDEDNGGPDGLSLSGRGVVNGLLAGVSAVESYFGDCGRG